MHAPDVWLPCCLQLAAGVASAPLAAAVAAVAVVLPAALASASTSVTTALAAGESCNCMRL